MKHTLSLVLALALSAFLYGCDRPAGNAGSGSTGSGSSATGSSSSGGAAGSGSSSTPTQPKKPAGSSSTPSGK